jgi:hypothetical protein
MIRRWAAAGVVWVVVGAACNDAGRGVEGAREPAEPLPGTVPVPGAASPGSAPDPHPAAAGPDAAYPGTVEPQPGAADTLRQAGDENQPRSVGAGRP